MIIKNVTINIDRSIDEKYRYEELGFEREDIIATEVGHGDHTDWITIWYELK